MIFVNWGIYFDIGNIDLRVHANLNKISQDNFYNNIELLQSIRNDQNILNTFNKIKSLYAEIKDALALSIEENSIELKEDILNIFKEFQHCYNDLKKELLFNGKYDNNNAIISLHAGAGGTEAQDWCAMLFRMYHSWAEKNNYKIETLNLLKGDTAGIKSIIFQINGERAYGLLKNENGIHRLIRISPFDAAGRRHTSFVSVEVMPEVESNTEINIKDEELKIDTYRASGAGGQHINKTESAIRITHLPSGLVVSCQSERSQHQNKATALSILKGKLVALAEEQHKDTIAELKGIKNEIAWGHQIRSYVFHPYSLIKDHRNNYETGNTTSFMNGDIDECLYSLLAIKEKNWFFKKNII